MTGTSTVHVAHAKAPLGEILNYRSLVGNFARRELRTRFKGSKIGWLWSLANPLATLAVYTVVFGKFLGADRGMQPSGSGRANSFAVYLFTGLVVWNIFSTVIVRNVGGLLEVGALRRKVYFPAIAPLAGITIAVLVELSVELGLLVAVYALLGNIGWTFLAVPFLVLLIAAFAFGLGLLLALANVQYRDVGYLLTIALQLLFYLSPIIYPITFVQKAIGTGFASTLYHANPITQYVLAFQDCLWQLRWPSFERLAYCSAWSVVVLVVGWVVFTRRSQNVAEDL